MGGYLKGIYMTKAFTIKYQERLPSGAFIPAGMLQEGADLADALVRFNAYCVMRKIDPEILSIEPLKGAELYVWNQRDANGNIDTMGD